MGAVTTLVEMVVTRLRGCDSVVTRLHGFILQVLQVLQVSQVEVELIKMHQVFIISGIDASSIGTYILERDLPGLWKRR